MRHVRAYEKKGAVVDGELQLGKDAGWQFGFEDWVQLGRGEKRWWRQHALGAGGRIRRETWSDTIWGELLNTEPETGGKHFTGVDGPPRRMSRARAVRRGLGQTGDQKTVTVEGGKLSLLIDWRLRRKLQRR